MRHPTTAIAIALTLASLLPTTLADFEVWMVKTLWPPHQGGSDIQFTYSIWDSKPSCVDLNNITAALYFPIKDDVSGDKSGLRCVGTCAFDDDLYDIQVLEMNFDDGVYAEGRFHWTTYKDRGFSLVSVSGDNAGSCTPTSDEGDEDSFDCEGTSDQRKHLWGRRKFICREPDVTASYIVSQYWHADRGTAAVLDNLVGGVGR